MNKPLANQVPAALRLGLRENFEQFALLVTVNAFVGAMTGMERSLLPVIAEKEFHIAARASILSFIAVFGFTKAVANFLAGKFCDRFGRKHVLVAGWVIATPVPFLLMWAEHWRWIVFANTLLGASQGLTWSSTVIMKIDLVGPARRGLAMGLNEFAGYLAVACAALGTAWIAAAYRLRPEPFYPGVGIVAFGLGLSLFWVRDTKSHAALESSLHAAPAGTLSFRDVFWKTTLRDRNLSSVTQAGFVNNLNDGMAWGLFPLFFMAKGMDLTQIGILAAVYPATWGVVQLGTGAWSDRVGRKRLIVGGMWVQAIAIGVIAVSSKFAWLAAGAVLLGIGTAMVYPTLLAAVADVAQPSWRASSVGTYRLWRDLGYVMGAVISGVATDLLGLDSAMWIVALLTLASGIVAAWRMTETLPSASCRTSESL